MDQSRTLYVGMDVHNDFIAVAYVAKILTPRSSPWGPLAHGSVTSTPDSAAAIQGQTPRLRLRSRPVRLLALSLPDEQRLRLLGRRPLLDSPKGRRPGQNRPS